MHSVTNTARTLQDVLLGYVADALGARTDATPIAGRSMPADTLLLTSPAVVLSVTCVSPPMFRAKALRLARREAIDVVLIRCCLTPLDVLPAAIDVVLAGGGLAPFALCDLAFYRHDDGALWLVPEGFGAAIRLGADGLELHLTPPYDALSERAGGIYRTTAELAGMLYPARPR
jgi:hypothetical protein